MDLLVEDRSRRIAESTKAVRDTLGGPQMFLGPVLAVPYTFGNDSSDKRLDGGDYNFFDESGCSSHSKVGRAISIAI